MFSVRFCLLVMSKAKTIKSQQKWPPMWADQEKQQQTLKAGKKSSQSFNPTQKNKWINKSN